MSNKPANQHHIYRIDTSKIIGRSGTHGYQVRIELKNEKPINKLFSDSKFKSQENALIKAKEWRDIQLKKLGIFEYHSRIKVDLPSNNKSGIIGIGRSEIIEEPSGAIREMWQTSFFTVDGKTKNRKFDVNRHGELGALKKAITARMEAITELIGIPEFKSSEKNIKILVDKYLDIVVYLEEISPVEEQIFLKTILDDSIKNTTKEEIIAGRIGQISFKKKIATLWGKKCAINQSVILLNASHIKPWAKCDDNERLDPFNGFLLSPLYDRSFDEGYISFEDNGNIILSKELKGNAVQLGISGNETIQCISPFHAVYLNYHRNSIFRK